MTTTIKKSVLKTNHKDIPYRIEKATRKQGPKIEKRFFLYENEGKDPVYSAPEFGDCCYEMFNRAEQAAIEKENQLELVG